MGGDGGGGGGVAGTSRLAGGSQPTDRQEIH
eukprot:SAG31_NODE_29717_length_391_cov_0.534247_1_plen_30_part_01